VPFITLQNMQEIIGHMMFPSLPFSAALALVSLVHN